MICGGPPLYARELTIRMRGAHYPARGVASVTARPDCSNWNLFVEWTQPDSPMPSLNPLGQLYYLNIYMNSFWSLKGYIYICFCDLFEIILNSLFLPFVSR